MTDKMTAMKKLPELKEFGRRLASIRKAKGFSQRDLARELGISNRVVAYYEAQSQHIPANLLIPIAKTLKVSLDELLGLKDFKEPLDSKHKFLWKKLRKIEFLSKKDQKAVLDHLDALLQKVPQDQSTTFKLPSLREAGRRKINVG